MPDESLVEVLQYRFDLRGARESCGQGLCGCCTVYVDSKPVSGCLYLAVMADGARVDTIEGLAVRRCARSGAAGFHRGRSVSMRLLHAGLYHDGEAASQRPSRSERRGGPALSDRQSLPLLGLSGNSRCGEAGCRRFAERRRKIRNCAAAITRLLRGRIDEVVT